MTKNYPSQNANSVEAVKPCSVNWGERTDLYTADTGNMELVKIQSGRNPKISWFNSILVILTRRF